MIRVETDEEYHSGEGVSKSTLWTLDTKTPFHARYGVRKPAEHFDFGHASHIAILEPDRLEEAITRGPEARGNSKEWKAAEDFAEAAGTILLKPDAHDMLLTIRDLAAVQPELELMRKDTGRIVETSAYHIDEETGQLVKTRPDLYSPKHKMILDLKNLADGSSRGFSIASSKFGYHMQHAHYSDVWEKGAELEVEAFFFVVFEKSDPPLVAVYELTPSAVEEGYARYRRALKTYAECAARNEWPGYATGVQSVALQRWAYQLTPPPVDAEDDIEEAGNGE